MSDRTCIASITRRNKILDDERHRLAAKYAALEMELVRARRAGHAHLDPDRSIAARLGCCAAALSRAPTVEDTPSLSVWVLATPVALRAIRGIYASDIAAIRPHSDLQSPSSYRRQSFRVEGFAGWDL